MEHRPPPPPRDPLSGGNVRDATAGMFEIQRAPAENTPFVCDNLVIYGNEECNCCHPQECTDLSCDPVTCELMPGSQCVQGPCWENCKFKMAVVGCREESYSCQIEYCNGSIANCPDDIHTMKGDPCSNWKTHCYYGVCKSFDLHREFPDMKDTSLRNGLLIFFFLVLPVVILTGIAVKKRDAIRRKLCRKSRGQRRGNNGEKV